ncbi:MAG: hypothetical protein L3J08_04770 [Flavobacteriaceae bacterium]|nr:hypothetical protein [Flavobacteriaceae bacterium]
MNALFLILLLLISAQYHQALYFIIPAISAFFLFNRKLKIPLNNYSKIFVSLPLVVIIFLILQVIINKDLPFFSIKGTFRYIVYSSFAIMVIGFDKKSIEKYFKYLSILLFILTPLAIYQYKTLGRCQGIFSHANHLAYIQVICIYFLIAYRPFQKTFRMLCLGVLLFTLLLTKTSGAFIILFLLAGYNFILTNKVSFKKKIAITITLLLTFPLFLIYSDKLLSQIDTLQYLDKKFILPRVKDYRAGGYGSLIWRIIYWTKIVFVFFEESLSTILFGKGIDSLTKGNMPYQFMTKDPHNDFIKVFFEFGLIGLLMFFNFLKNIFLMLKKNVNLIIILLVPLVFDNIIVNFSFVLTILLIFAYEFKSFHTKNN